MATYAIGDIQGCFRTFQALLARIAFDPGRDRLWLAGDLVNRGPRSAEVLRWCVAHEPVVSVVLGNHDLHLLLRAEGLRPKKARDSVEDVLQSADRGQLLGYLTRQPFLHREGPWVMVHAGLDPRWSVAEATERALALKRHLQGPERRAFLSALGEPGRRDDRFADAASDAAAFTRLRTVGRDGAPRFDFDGPPEAAPAGQLPWFAWPGRASRDHSIIFGHWAALGLHLAPGIAGLDSGCVWGKALSALRLEDRAVFQAGFVD